MEAPLATGISTTGYRRRFKIWRPPPSRPRSTPMPPGSIRSGWEEPFSPVSAASRTAGSPAKSTTSQVPLLFTENVSDLLIIYCLFVYFLFIYSYIIYYNLRNPSFNKFINIINKPTYLIIYNLQIFIRYFIFIS